MLVLFAWIPSTFPRELTPAAWPPLCAGVCFVLVLLPADPQLLVKLALVAETAGRQPQALLQVTQHRAARFWRGPLGLHLVAHGVHHELEAFREHRRGEGLAGEMRETYAHPLLDLPREGRDVDAIRVWIPPRLPFALSVTRR
jgi:hypothetical protein